MLSTVSPINAITSITRSGGTPRISCTRFASTITSAFAPPDPVRSVRTFFPTSCIMSLSFETTNIEVLVVSNDKDMMQLVGKNVRTLRTGSGGAKADVIVDAKRVQEILGVPPERVIDVMALMGDTVDTIPGAKGIGEKGATELIQKY